MKNPTTTKENIERAERARLALMAYAKDAYHSELQAMISEPEMILSDFLCDLKHYADMVELDFYEALDHAESHYHAEMMDDESEK